VGDVKCIALTADERELIRSLYPPLQRLAAVVAPPEVDPEDLVQEAFLRALRRGPLSGLDYPGAYLRKAICHLASNQRRRLARQRRALARSSPSDPVVQAYPSDLADLLRLRPAARAVLYLREVEGLSFAEVATLLGRSEMAVRSIASRARRQLRQEFRKEVERATA